MPTGSIAPLFLLLFVVFAGLLTLTESRAVPRARSDDADPTDTDAADDDLPITSQRARCVCMHAREGHERCATAACGCARYVYAGGLVESSPGLSEVSAPDAGGSP